MPASKRPNTIPVSNPDSVIDIDRAPFDEGAMLAVQGIQIWGTTLNTPMIKLIPPRVPTFRANAHPTAKTQVNSVRSSKSCLLRTRSPNGVTNRIPRPYPPCARVGTCDTASLETPKSLATLRPSTPELDPYDLRDQHGLKKERSAQRPRNATYLYVIHVGDRYGLLVSSLWATMDAQTPRPKRC